MLNYNIANCQPRSILQTCENLSSILALEGIAIKPITLFHRFYEAGGFACGEEPLYSVENEINIQIPSQAALYGYLTRDNISFKSLRFNDHKQLCFAIAKSLKSDGVCKLGGMAFLSRLAKALNWPSYQSMEANQTLIKPEVKIVTFEDKGQDFFKFLIEDGVVIDCLPFQSFCWVGKNVHYDNFRNKIMITKNKTSIKDSNYDYTNVGDSLGSIHYPVEKIEVISEQEKLSINDWYNH